MRRTRTPAPLPATERPADPAADTPVVAQIRDASRALVRDWGFMGGRFAGTDLSPSAVHALIEVEGGGLSARDLGQRLRLEKSSVSRMLAKLVAADLVAEQPVPGDARLKQLSLTAAGRQRVQAIHAHARDQVLGALGRLRPDEVETVCRGLSLYAGALGSEPTPAAPPAPAAVQVLRGYRSGVIAHITRMHAEYYAQIGRAHV